MGIKVVVAVMLLGAAASSFADERQECRHKRHLEEIADCIERGVYDPCDDGSNRGLALCGPAHVELAERRLKNSTTALLALFDAWALPDASKQFMAAQASWRQYRDQHCKASNSLAGYFIAHSEEAIYAMDISETFCVLRLTQSYASELELTLSKARQ